MKNSPTFSCLRSVNNRYNNKLSQEDEYQSYLKRIDQIVYRKPSKDLSPQRYMKFLHRIKDKSRDHKQNEDGNKISLENKYLLEKIVQSKARKMQTSSTSYHYQVAVHEKRFRQIQRINQDNKKMADRISAQNSVLRKTLLHEKNETTIRDGNKSSQMGSSRQSPQKSFHKQNSTVYAGWNYSPLKHRKLPRLVGNSSQNTGIAKNHRDSLGNQF